MKSKKLPYRPNVCMLLLNKNGKLFLGERNGEPGVWQFPQGGAEKEFTLEENVLKELHEETGADKKHFKIIKKLKSRHRYKFDKVPKYARGKWCGQSQTFWLVKYLGKNSNFKLKRFKPEFMDYCWCSINEVLDLTEPKRLKGYRKVLKELVNLKSERLTVKIN